MNKMKDLYDQKLKKLEEERIEDNRKHKIEINSLYEKYNLEKKEWKIHMSKSLWI